MKKFISSFKEDSIQLWKGHNDEISIFLFICFLDLLFVIISNKEAATYAHTGLFVPEIILYIIIIKRSNRFSVFIWFIIWTVFRSILSFMA